MQILFINIASQLNALASNMKLLTSYAALQNLGVILRGKQTLAI